MAANPGFPMTLDVKGYVVLVLGGDEEAAEKARYLLSLFAASLSAQDPRRQMLIARVLQDFERLSKGEDTPD